MTAVMVRSGMTKTDRRAPSVCRVAMDNSQLPTSQSSDPDGISERQREALQGKSLRPAVATIMVTPDACERRKVLQAAKALSIELWPASGIQMICWQFAEVQQLLAEETAKLARGA